MTHRCWPYPGEPCQACESEPRNEWLAVLGYAAFFTGFALLLLFGVLLVVPQ